MHSVVLGKKEPEARKKKQLKLSYFSCINKLNEQTVKLTFKNNTISCIDLYLPPF